MQSFLPETPGRGRSRFSKVLPPEPPKVPAKGSSPISKLLDSTLPPLPKDAMSSIPVLRRPVGRTGQNSIAKSLSIASVSSIYSDAQGLSPTVSESSSSTTKDSLVDGDSGTVSTSPSVYSKEDESQSQSLISPGTPDSTTTDSASNTFQSSPPRPEIWRRRSVRSDKSIVVSDLRIDKSNGATAIAPNQEPTERSLPQPPQSNTSQRKPIPVRPASRQSGFMGNKISKLNEKNFASKSSDCKDEGKRPSTPTNRPSTPKYTKADGILPHLPRVISPAEPDTQPDKVAAEAVPRSNSRMLLNPQLDSQQDNLDSLRTPELSHSRQSSDTLTVTSQQLQPTSSISDTITQQPSSPPSDDTSPLPLSPNTPVVTIHFPKLASLAPKGSILPGLPLDNVHIECYQSHKFMRGTKNHYCPVACMICQRQDMNMRWKCTWCCLSACGSCMKVLDSIPGRQLAICLETLGV